MQKQKICYLIGAMPSEGERYIAQTDDLVIAADAGWRRAAEFGLSADIAVGDFDTAPPPDDIETILHPARKDDTDLLLAAKVGLARGYRSFVLLGVSGGRPDHSIAAYQTLLWLNGQGARGYLCAGGMTATILNHERIILNAPTDTLFSLFAVGGTAEGVTVDGASYPLQRAMLSPAYPLGISNRFTEAPLTISVEKGSLLMLAEGTAWVSAMEAGRNPLLDTQKEGCINE